MLIQKNAEVGFSNLIAGDYIINNQIIVERKSAEDFIQSIINNRLFEQCSKLKTKSERTLIVVEGDPYKTKHKINEHAIRGALLSVMTSWQIPLINSKHIEDSVEILCVLGMQSLKNSKYVRIQNGFRPKRIKNQTLRFLQGLPGTGPTLAGRLLEHFGNIRSIVNATDEELTIIEGLGKKKANKIIDFVSQHKKCEPFQLIDFK